MSGFFLEDLHPTSTSRSARINSGDIVVHIRAKDAIPKRSVKSVSLLTSKHAENRHWDFVRKRVRKSVEGGILLPETVCYVSSRTGSERSNGIF